MALTLNIDTSTSVCSVALTAEGAVLCHYEDFKGRNHAALLSGYIKGCLDWVRDHEMKLEAVAVSMGPGSYTGLRIGLSEAKGLAFALDIPLIGVDTLKIMAVHTMFNFDVEPDDRFMPMIDARRMEVYTAVYDMALQTVEAPQPLIVEPDSLDRAAAEAAPGRLLIMGDGSNKIKDVVRTPGVVFVDDVAPLAVDMMPLAEKAYRDRDFLDIAYCVPEYLKEFQATKPKNPLGK